MPSGSAPFQWKILGRQLSQRRKRSGNKRSWTIFNAPSSFSTAMVVVMNGKEHKNKQKERGRRTEIRKRLKGKGDKRCTTNFWRQLMFMRISEPLPRKYVWTFIAWNSWCAEGRLSAPAAGQFPSQHARRGLSWMAVSAEARMGRWQRSSLPWVGSK